MYMVCKLSFQTESILRIEHADPDILLTLRQ